MAPALLTTIFPPLRGGGPYHASTGTNLVEWRLPSCGLASLKGKTRRMKFGTFLVCSSLLAAGVHDPSPHAVSVIAVVCLLTCLRMQMINNAYVFGAGGYEPTTHAPTASSGHRGQLRTSRAIFTGARGLT